MDSTPSAWIAPGSFRSSQPRKPGPGLPAWALCQRWAYAVSLRRSAAPSGRWSHPRGRRCRTPGCRRAAGSGGGGEPGRIDPPGRHGLEQGRVENVSTRPVVMVTPLIHSDSRCSVAGLPCTRTLATRLHGRINSVHCSKVSGMPTASTATSAPRPSVSRSISARACSGAVTTLAPNLSAQSRRGRGRRSMVRLASALVVAEGNNRQLLLFGADAT